MSTHSKPATAVVIHFHVRNTSNQYRIVVPRKGYVAHLEKASNTALGEAVWIPTDPSVAECYPDELIRQALLLVFADLPPFNTMLYPQGVKRIGDRIEIELGLIRD